MFCLCGGGPCGQVARSWYDRKTRRVRDRPCGDTRVYLEVEIRGVETSGVLRTLCERKLVRIVGRKDVPGRPIMYGTTKFFLEHFGLQDLSQLPPLREFKELGESEQSLLPIEDESPEVVETSQPAYSGELPLTSDQAEGEVSVAFEAETNEELLVEPVEQS